MVKGKRNGLAFTECSVKVCRFLICCFHRRIEMKLPQCNAIGVRTPPGSLARTPKMTFRYHSGGVMLPCIFENCNSTSLILCLIAAPNE